MCAITAGRPPSRTIDKIGTGYTLSASATGPTPAVSAPFNVTLGPASKLAILGAPLTVPALGLLGRRVRQQDQDRKSVV